MRPEKSTIVDDVRVKLTGSPYLIVVEYTGMKVPHFADLRKRLSGAGAELHVVKNTFLRLAAKELGMPDLGNSLSGQNAMVTGEIDICAAAKVLKTFNAEFERPAVKAGILDRSPLAADQINALADLPPKEILRARLLAMLLAPAAKLVRTLNEPGACLARVLKARCDAVGGAAKE